MKTLQEHIHQEAESKGVHLSEAKAFAVKFPQVSLAESGNQSLGVDGLSVQV